MHTSDSTLGHLALVHFHFGGLNPGGRERCIQEKAISHSATSRLGPPECACARASSRARAGKPGANLLPLILEDAGVPGRSAWSLAQGPSWAARGRTNSPGGCSARPSETALAPPERPGLGLGRREVGGRSTPAPPSGAWRAYEAPQGKVIGFRAPRCLPRTRKAAAGARGAWAEAGEGRVPTPLALPRPGDLARAGRGRKASRPGEELASALAPGA